MGLLDLPGPLFGLIDQVLAGFVPDLLRLALWGVLAGWLTMLVYRRLSNQEKIQSLKAEQKIQQKAISEFDGELGELLPLIRHTLGLGMRQLSLSLGPALLSAIPVLFLVVWVAGRFGHEQPSAEDTVIVTANEISEHSPALAWQPASAVRVTPEGWEVRWPRAGQQLALTQSELLLLRLPAEAPIPVIHKKRWWNLLMANPIGYLPEQATVDMVSIGLPPQQFLNFGPAWIRGWMFSFFGVFLVSSIAFKLLLRID
jgi:hypothetical protein